MGTQDIAQKAIFFGHPPVNAGYAIWPISLAGGFLPKCGIQRIPVVSQWQLVSGSFRCA